MYFLWLKTVVYSGTSSNAAAIQFAESNNSGTTAGAATTTPYVKTTQDWTLYTRTFTTSASTAYVQTSIRVYGHTGTGTLIMDAWFDDIVLKPTSA